MCAQVKLPPVKLLQHKYLSLPSLWFSTPRGSRQYAQVYILECDQIVKEKLQFNNAASHHDVTEIVQNTLHGVCTNTIAY